MTTQTRLITDTLKGNMIAELRQRLRLADRDENAACFRGVALGRFNAEELRIIVAALALRFDTFFVGDIEKKSDAERRLLEMETRNTRLIKELRELRVFSWVLSLIMAGCAVLCLFGRGR